MSEILTCVGRGSTRADVAAAPLLSLSLFRSPSSGTETQSRFTVNPNVINNQSRANRKRIPEHWQESHWQRVWGCCSCCVLIILGGILCHAYGILRDYSWAFYGWELLHWCSLLQFDSTGWATVLSAATSLPVGNGGEILGQLEVFISRIIKRIVRKS